jgi:dihydrofolate reductase / thymidylate synthase
MRSFSVIAAATQKDRGIGFQNAIPWRLKHDMEEFKRITLEAKEGFQNAIIMGRKTWESIPKRFRPLAGRFNVVLTRSVDKEKDMQGAAQAGSLKLAFQLLPENVDKVFIAGGAKVYAEALLSPYCERIYHTTIFKEYTCDTFFPVIDPTRFELQIVGPILQDGDIQFQFTQYTRLHEEFQYLDLVRSCIATGNMKPNRTGIDTYSHFGRMMKFNLRGGTFPLFTTKMVFWRGVVEELLWMIRGSTDSKQLTAKRVKIWDGNGSREFLDKLGFTDREVGDLGPSYGHQWRHFGAPYVDCHTDYSDQGTDQLAEVINKIKTDPDDRRILMSAWHPGQLNQVALPPCHVLSQFYIYDGELSCLMYQRSCDLGLGTTLDAHTTHSIFEITLV